MAVIKRIQSLLAFLVKVAVRFYRDDCFMRASALAYVSLLSLVPLLAVIFAVLKGLGVPRKIEPLVLARLPLPAETIATILAAIERVNVSVVGAVGGALLLTSVVSLLAAIEGALNHVWRVREGRTWWRRLTEYLGLVFLIPFLLLGGIALTSTLRLGHVIRVAEGVPFAGEFTRWALAIAPVALNGVGLLLLYVVLPNRVPKWRGVVLGAAVGGLLWQIVQWLYVSLQIGVARYSAVYGALAQLPITLVWFYASWAVFLFGAEFAAVAEFAHLKRAARQYPQSILAVQALRSAWLAFCDGTGSFDIVDWAKRYAIPPETVLELMGILSAWGWLRQAAIDDDRHYVVACHPRNWKFDRLAELEGARVPGEVDPVVCRLWHLMKAEVAQWWHAVQGGPLAEELFPGAFRLAESREVSGMPSSGA